MEENRNQLKEAIDAIFSSTETTNRTIKGYRGCITRGYVDIQDFSHCGDIKCESCNMMSKALKDIMNYKPNEPK